EIAAQLIGTLPVPADDQIGAGPQPPRHALGDGGERCRGVMDATELAQPDRRERLHAERDPIDAELDQRVEPRGVDVLGVELDRDLAQRARLDRKALVQPGEQPPQLRGRQHARGPAADVDRVDVDRQLTRGATGEPLALEPGEPRLDRRTEPRGATDLEVEVAVRTRPLAKRHVHVQADAVVVHSTSVASSSPAGSSAKISTRPGSWTSFDRAATPRHHQLGSALTLTP